MGGTAKRQSLESKEMSLDDREDRLNDMDTRTNEMRRSTKPSRLIVYATQMKKYDVGSMSKTH